MKKLCNGCGEVKDLEKDFHKNKDSKSGRCSICKNCRNLHNREYEKNRILTIEQAERKKQKDKDWFLNNKDKVYNAKKKYRLNNYEHSLAQQRIRYRRWYKKNKEEISKRQKDKRRTNPEYKLSSNMRNELRKCLVNKNRSSSKYLSMFGYSIKDLVIHLEKQFNKKMSWSNYGSYWHIDHIIPISSFDLTKEDELVQCWCLCNLRPLEAKENRIKSDKIEFLL